MLRLFDMTPMIGAKLKPGQPLLVVVALSMPAGLRRQDGSNWTLETGSWRPQQEEGNSRPELYSRQWSLIARPGHSLLIPHQEVISAGLTAGDPVVWANGRHDLLAWKAQPAAITP
jgi:hypothetical protein